MAAPKSALLLSDSPLVPGAVLDSFSSYNSLSINNVKVVASSDDSVLDKIFASVSSVDIVLSTAESPGRHTFEFLSKISKILKNGGKLIVQEPVAARTPTKEESLTISSKARNLQSSSDVERNLILSGFSSCSTSTPFDGLSLDPEWMGITPAYIGSTLGPLLRPFAVVVSKPSWKTGSSFTLRKKSSSVKPETPNISPNGASKGPVSVQPSPSPAAWNVSGNGVDDDIIDEDSLLTPEDMAPTPQVLPDCGNTRVAKKACKNCTCGRAELEQKAEANILTLDQINNPQSACGSCGLGDAFRCAGCPYRGLPPFKLGEKVSISSSILAADV